MGDTRLKSKTGPWVCQDCDTLATHVCTHVEPLAWLCEEHARIHMMLDAHAGDVLTVEEYKRSRRP